MSQLQFERQSRTTDRAQDQDAKASRRTPASGGEGPVASEGGESAAGGDVGVDAWVADDGLMSAMGLGGESEGGEAQSAEGGERGERGEGKAAAGNGAKRERKKKAKQAQGESRGGEGQTGSSGPGGPVQHAGLLGAIGGASVHETAASGIGGSGGSLPHLDTIQASFGKHDVSGVSAHTDTAAASANRSMGSEAYATGNHVAFGSSSPSLHTAAHEAAHVVQQRSGAVQLKGGVGQVGDAYERHADAVADMVVQGKSAEPLLSQMAPGGGAASAGVQAKLIQFDIKADLRKAMEGWGTDEEAIFRRCERATVAEAQAVIADAALMSELESELSRGDMTRVLDGLRAPLPDKLKLAMRGWGTDEEYIHRSLMQASPADLAAVANDNALVTQLEGELSGGDLRQVLDRLPVPLSRKLKFAVRGWGTDEEYLFRSLESANAADAVAVANDAALMAEIDADLSGEELHRFRGTLARKVWTLSANGKVAFKLCMGERADRAARLRWVGDITVQRALLDSVIVAGNPADMVIQAFQSYWEVETTVVEGATAWNPNTVIAIHRQMKLLPSQDTRAGVWNELQLTGNADLINRAAWNGSALIVGANIDPATAGTQTYGFGSTLTAAANIGDTTLTVQEGPRFSVNDQIAVERNVPANKDTGKVTGVAGNVVTIDTALTKAHGVGAQVTPDDDSAFHEVPYLDATVRHEIGHAVETAMGGVTGFTEGIGGWWTGDNIDTWANQMTNPWVPNDGSTISGPDLQRIKDTIKDAVTNRKGSLVALAATLDATHPLAVNIGKGVPAIDAANACLQHGDSFFSHADQIVSSNGKRFSVSWWYKCFMSHNESVVTQRVSDYTLYAPAEFFAEAYTVFYEEAHRLGTPGFTEADLGRNIRDAGQRSWIRTNVHNRGHAPAPAAPAGGGPGATPAPGSEAPVGVARAGGAGYGKRSGNPGP